MSTTPAHAEERLTKAARRNAAFRAAQVGRLRERLATAGDFRAHMAERRRRANAATESLEFMAKMKCVPGFFPTPPGLVDEMLALAEIEPLHSVLEPSAGKGDLANGAVQMGAKPKCIELNFGLASHLEKLGFDTVQGDFLEMKPEPFDRVLMNPPFENRADVKHTLHAMKFLKPRGVLVSCMSSTGAALLAGQFHRRCYLHHLPPGQFASSERPTMVNVSLFVYHQP